MSGASPSLSSTHDDRPNVVIVVLDCVRADDFERRLQVTGELPVLQRLRRQSVVFPRAAAVAPWTVPSHATIFTGLYPWEHRAHAKGTLPLNPTLPRMPALLRDAGYATTSLSANPLLNPELGLLKGFQSTAWSEWWEPYVRNTPSSTRAKRLQEGGSTPADGESRLQRLHDGPLVSVLHKLAGLVYRYPFALDAANRILQRVINPNAHEPGEVARWLDPTFADWVESVPSRQPIFAFVNLLEAHEPYFLDPRVVLGVTDYLRYARTWQDRPSVLNGRWVPTPEELRLLHELFTGTFRLLDARVGQLIATLEAAGRWENTLFILTSDHGQAFCEKGTLFHMHRPDEALLRIPLWVRYPHGARGPTTAQGWASLVDLAPTVLEAAGVPIPPSFSGVPLPTLERDSRRGPVLAMADGLALPQERSQIPPDRMAWIDRLWTAAYADDRKVTLDVAGRHYRAYDLSRDPGELIDVWSESPSEFELLATAAGRVGDALSGEPNSEISSVVEDRLRSWGYL